MVVGCVGPRCGLVVMPNIAVLSYPFTKSIAQLFTDRQAATEQQGTGLARRKPSPVTGSLAGSCRSWVSLSLALPPVVSQTRCRITAAWSMMASIHDTWIMDCGGQCHASRHYLAMSSRVRPVQVQLPRALTAREWRLPVVMCFVLEMRLAAAGSRMADPSTAMLRRMRPFTGNVCALTASSHPSSFGPSPRFCWSLCKDCICGTAQRCIVPELAVCDNRKSPSLTNGRLDDLGLFHARLMRPGPPAPHM